MAVTQSDLDQLRNEIEAKLARVTIESMNTATAIGAYGERFNAMDIRFDSMDRRFDETDRRLDRMDDRFDRMDDRFDRMDDRFDRMDSRFDRMDDRFDQVDRRFERLEDKLDNRFGWQTVMFAALGLLTLFGDAVRGAIGL